MLRAFAVLVVLAGLAPRAASQAPPPATPQARWRSLPEEERERLRKAYGEFRKLPPEQQEALRARTREAARERERLESKLSPMEREALAALGPDAKDQWLRGVLREQLRRRSRGSAVVTPEKLKELRDLAPEARREALRALLESAGRASVERTLDGAVKRKLLTEEERDRIKALPVREAAKEALGVRKRIVEARLEENPESRPPLNDAEWAELRAMSPQRFFERLEVLRAIHDGPKPGGPPDGGPKGRGPRAKPEPPAEDAVRARAKAYFRSSGLSEEEAEALAAQKPLSSVFSSVLKQRRGPAPR